MSFSAELLAASADLLERQERHPFLAGLSDGSLPREKYLTWLRQDDRYLALYAQALAAAADAVSAAEDQRLWQDALDLTLAVEIPIHREQAAQVGLSAHDLETTPLHPVTRAYGDLLVATAKSGSQALILASHLPCAWDYSHLGRQLLARGLPADPLYTAWIRAYAAPEFQALARSLAEALDRHVPGLPEAERGDVADLFHRARAFELRFWDMCWDPTEFRSGEESKRDPNSRRS